jgi:hypothetical protein
VTIEEFLRLCAEAGAAQQVPMRVFIGTNKTAHEVKAVKLTDGALAIKVQPVK